MSASEHPDKQALPSLARNVVWSGMAQGWTFALSIVSILALARLIPPREYAVMAVVGPIVGIGHQIQAIGLGSAIVQSRDVSKSRLSTLFWLALAISIGLAATLVSIAPAVARLFGNPLIGPALSVAALTLIFASLGLLPGALLARGLRFREIALRNMAVTTFGTAITVFVAWHIHNHWALVAGLLTMAFGNFLANVSLARWMPGRPGPIASVRSMLHFGLNVWAANLFVFISRHADNLVVASVATPRQLGLYDRAYMVLLRPITQGVGPLGQVLVPTLTRYVEEASRYRTHYWRAVTVLLLALNPALALAVVNPQVLVGVLLGPLWMEAAPLFAWFAAAGMFLIFTTTLDWLLLSQGRSGDFMRKNLTASIVALSSFAIGVNWGVEGIAMAFVLGQGLLCAPFALWWTGRKGPVSHREMLRGIAPHALALTAVIAAVWGARKLTGSPLWPELIATGLAAYAVYAAVLLLYPENRELVAEAVRRARPFLFRSDWRRS